MNPSAIEAFKDKDEAAVYAQLAQPHGHTKTQDFNKLFMHDKALTTPLLSDEANRQAQTEFKKQPAKQGLPEPIRAFVHSAVPADWPPILRTMLAKPDGQKILLNLIVPIADTHYRFEVERPMRDGDLCRLRSRYVNKATNAESRSLIEVCENEQHFLDIVHSAPARIEYWHARTQPFLLANGFTASCDGQYQKLFVGSDGKAVLADVVPSLFPHCVAVIIRKGIRKHPHLVALDLAMLGDMLDMLRRDPFQLSL